MEAFVEIIFNVICDIVIGVSTIILIAACAHFLFKDRDADSKSDSGCQDSKNQHGSHSRNGRLKTPERQPTENDDVFHETMLKVSETQRERLQSLEENIRMENEQDSLARDLEQCLRRLSDGSATRDVKISVEAVLKSNQLQNDDVQLSEEQIKSLTNSVLEDADLNDAILDTVTAVVMSVLQQKRDGQESDLERSIIEHDTQLTDIHEILQRLDRYQCVQQRQVDDNTGHTQMVLAKHQRLQANVKQIESQVAALKNHQSDSQNSRARLKEIADRMREEQQEHTATEMHALREMTRRQLESLKCLGEKIHLIENWLSRSKINSELTALRNSSTQHSETLDELDSRVTNLNERVESAIKRGVNHNVIQKQVDGIGVSVKRIDESMARLLSKNGNSYD